MDFKWLGPSVTAKRWTMVEEHVFVEFICELPPVVPSGSVELCQRGEILFVHEVRPDPHFRSTFEV